MEKMTPAIPHWLDLINISFLTAVMKTKYTELLNTRFGIQKIQ